MFNTDEIAREILSLLPHRQDDWEYYLAQWGGKNEPYSNMLELAGYVLDEIIYETTIAQSLADLLERLYDQTDDRAKEILTIGLIEDMCAILHGVWNKQGLYQEKKEILLKYLGNSVRKAFLSQEAFLGVGDVRN